MYGRCKCGAAVYGAWPGKIHTGSFYDGVSFDEFWTENSYTSTIHIRQIDTSYNIGLSDSITMTFDPIKPTFTSSTSNRIESYIIGQEVYKATSTDDVGRVTYSLGTAGGDENVFFIDSNTGSLTFSSDSNPAKELYNVEVVATDTAGNDTFQEIDLQISTLQTLPLILAPIVIYPNPTQGKFTIDLGSSLFYIDSIDIYNLLGQKVYAESNFENEKIEIDLSTMPKGVYFVRITTKSNFTHIYKLKLE